HITGQGTLRGDITRGVNLLEGKALAIAMIGADLARQGQVEALQRNSPDGDPGKFVLGGRPVRIITHRDGYYLNVNLAWFRGEETPAQISGGPIWFYSFVLRGPPI